jgi:hypothetical protein
MAPIKITPQGSHTGALEWAQKAWGRAEVFQGGRAPKARPARGTRAGKVRDDRNGHVMPEGDDDDRDGT